MHYVYVIKSLANKQGFVYIGQTNDLKRRFAEHNAGQEISTKAYTPFRLVYYEAYAEKKDALARERALKKYGSSWGHLRLRIHNSLSMQSKGRGGKSEHSVDGSKEGNSLEKSTMVAGNARRG